MDTQNIDLNTLQRGDVVEVVTRYTVVESTDHDGDVRVEGDGSIDYLYGRQEYRGAVTYAPRPLTSGDRVQFKDAEKVHPHTVVAILDGKAWCRSDRGVDKVVPVEELTRYARD